MKVLLIIPPKGYLATTWSRENIMPPLGVLYLAAFLEQNGIEVEIIDAFIEKYSWNQLKKAFLDKKPDVVGVSFTTETRFDGFKTIKIAKQVLPNSLVVAGGVHVSLTPQDTLSYIPELDMIVRGEGEETFLELIKTFEKGESFNRVAGISFRQNNRIIHNPSRAPIKDLNKIPFPARHLLSKKYKLTLDVPGKGKIPAAHIMSSRGCPIGCNFCASSQMWGRMFRYRSPENVLAEIEWLIKEYGVRGIWFFDDTLTMNRERVRDICDLILERHLDISWYCEVRVDTVDRELLKKMKEAGCYQVCFGVESGSQRVIDEIIGKKITLEQVRKVARWCGELGLLIFPTFIVSHPTETFEEAQQTIALMRELKSYAQGDVTIGILKIYPGTRLEEYAKETGFLPSDFSWAAENDSRVILLPTVAGNAPLFIDKLSWEEINEILFEWRELSHYPLLKKIPGILKDIRSLADLKRLFIALISFIKYLFKKSFIRERN
ncbi:MAG: B12-binding domain-containing radical SAM protein [Patescibacteria group bacterium]